MENQEVKQVDPRRELLCHCILDVLPTNIEINVKSICVRLNGHERVPQDVKFEEVAEVAEFLVQCGYAIMRHGGYKKIKKVQ